MKRDDNVIAETPRLIIRKFLETDLDNLARLFGNPQVMQFMGDEVFSREQSEQELVKYLRQYQERGWGLQAAVTRSTDDFVGRCGLMQWELPAIQGIEVSYALLSEFWDKGLATEAASAVRDYAFDSLEINKLISLVDTGNDRSIKVAQKVHDSLEKEIIFFGQETLVYSTISQG